MQRHILLTLLALLFANLSFAQEKLPEPVIEKIYHNVYLHKSYQKVKGFGLVSSNGLVVVDGDNAFIIDTPWSAQDTETLVNWIKANGYKVAGSVSTHSHDDTSAGIGWLNEHGFSTYASQQTNKLLKQAGKAQASYSFNETIFTLPQSNIEVFYPGEGHAPDNVVVWLPKQKLLFGGCLVKSRASKSLGYVGDANIPQWPKTIKNVLAQYPNVLMVVPGHGRVGDISLLDNTHGLAMDNQK